MKKCFIQNLAMTVTNQCNLDCAHCLKGLKDHQCMSDAVIEATLEQVKGVNNLCICGGEPTLAIDRIEKIISYVIENHIYLEEFTITINGTIYSPELLKLLKEINQYIGNELVCANVAISLDKYHLDEVKRLNIMKEFTENLNRYKESKFFAGFRTINKKLFREGNAIYLDKKVTVPLRPIRPVITYAVKKKKLDILNGSCNIGPIIAINPNGMITECDASIEHQETLYNYGNVLTDLIEVACLKNGSRVLTPKKYEKETFKLMKKYCTYNR